MNCRWLLVFATIVSLCTATLSSVRLPNGPDGSKVIAVSAIQPACNENLFVLREGNGNCLAIARPALTSSLSSLSSLSPAPVSGSAASAVSLSSYAIEELGCPSEVQGATNVKCVDSQNGQDAVCYVYNHAKNLLVGVRNGAIISKWTLSFSADLKPTVFEANYWTETNPYQVMFFFADNNNKIWWVLANEGASTYLSATQIPANVTGNIINIEHLYVSWYILVGVEGGSSIQVFLFYVVGQNAPATPQFSFGNFGNLTAFSVGNKNPQQIYAYDESTKTLSTIAPTPAGTQPGGQVTLLTGLTGVKFLASGLETVFVINDGYGFIKYDHPIEFSAVVTAPTTSTSNDGIITASLHNGYDSNQNLYYWVTLGRWGRQIKKLAPGTYTVRVHNDYSSQCVRSFQVQVPNA